MCGLKVNLSISAVDMFYCRLVTRTIRPDDFVCPFKQRMVVLIAGIQRPLKFDSGITSHLFATELQNIIGTAQLRVCLMRTKVAGRELVRYSSFSAFKQAEYHISIFHL